VVWQSDGGAVRSSKSPAEIAFTVSFEVAQGGAVMKHHDEEMSEVMSKRRKGYP
jgi:hypothetical protein